MIQATNEIILRTLDDEALREKVRHVDRAVEHATALTRQLLAFGRQQVLKPEPTDLNLVVEETLVLVERLIGAQIRLDRELAPRLDSIDVDRSQLQQVILNLGVNARDAMPDGGILTVRTANRVLDESYASEHVDVTPGRYVVIEITDSGAGMDPETRERVFDPFFTTKTEGTGLGLATVYGIVKQSGGHIWIYSELGLGTTFRIYFPASESAATTREPEAPSDESLSGNETILVVEDAALLRPIVTEMLELHGYTVFPAADGAEALALAEQHNGAIDLLLTDVVMPGMNGRELAEQLVARYPAIKVLFTSGYPSDTVIRLGIADARVAFIQKPYVGHELLAEIRTTLTAE